MIHCSEAIVTWFQQKDRDISRVIAAIQFSLHGILSGVSHLPDVLLLKLKLLGIIVVDDFEGFATVCKVARVDPDLLECLCHDHGHLRLEMNVCHQWSIVPAIIRGVHFA